MRIRRFDSPMLVHLIRHAESENNARPPHQRVEDPAITRRGGLQTECLVKWTSTLRIDALITSPFLRALQTTRPILDARATRLSVWHDVFERGGCYSGHLIDDCRGRPGLGRADILRLVAADPLQCDIDASIDDAGWWNRPHREPDDDSQARADAVTRRLIDTFASDRDDVPPPGDPLRIAASDPLPQGDASQPLMIAVVTHADFIRCLLRSMLGGTLDPDSLGPLVNTGITRVAYHADRWRLDWFNSATHLPERLITGHQ